MSNSEYSQLLTKMSELKSLTGEYKSLTEKYRPATSVTLDSVTGNTDRYTLKKDINAMSSTATPLVVRPGEDYKEYWKYVGEVKGTLNDLNSKSKECWNMAANDPRLFKAVVYTGNSDALSSNPGQSEWNNRCYGLMWDATGADVSYNTKSTGYSTMVGPGSGANSGTNGIYTKLGITDGNGPTANIAAASKLYDLQLRVNSLVEEIAAVSDSGINKELKELVGSATDANTLIEKINQYMNGSVSAIDTSYNIIDKRKEMNNVYSEINGQTTLRARKYRFVFYIVIAISIIIGYASYTSKLSLIDQIDALKNYIPLGWWMNWWIITIVVIVFILSSFGWDMKGNILMVIRYLSDPEFWTGQLWWVGVTFFLLLVIFFYASFKSFFVEFDAGMKGLQEGMDGE
jgi:hypothetical protein